MYRALLPFLILPQVFVSNISVAQGDQLKKQPGEPPAAVIVPTKYGYVRGMAESSDLAIFLGIPYAAPPIGNLRWKIPTEPRKWKDTLTTNSYGPACP